MDAVKFLQERARMCNSFSPDKEKVVKWVEWANKADPSEYDPFAKQEVQ